jgi:hypothetical protein
VTYSLTIEEHSIFGFRTFLTATADQTDVRPEEEGVPLSLAPGLPEEPVDNCAAGSTTAYDRSDDRIFRDPFSSGFHRHLDA